MDFQDLKYHIEEFGCSVDPFYEDAHFASNCINGHCCIIEDLPLYSIPTLCHYFYELGIPSTPELREEYNRYRDLRDEMAGRLRVPKGESI